MTYPFAEIEEKWQALWQKQQTFKTNLDNFKQKKYYVLDMFPYPSGSGLHVGHPKGYCATDIMARYHLMHGDNVLHPIGWDAFGLPAEQYALQTGNDPAVFTTENINHFRKQLQRIGFSFDYSKEINTTDPNYYKITQTIFLKLYQQGLASIENKEVNFCPALGTVLANEEIILVNGQMVSERGNYPVEKRFMKQWVLKITHYAEKLLAGLDSLDWPHSVKELQRNWIGKSVGATVKFILADTETNEAINVFTSRIDTIFGITYLAIAPEHELVSKLTTAKQVVAVNDYLTMIKSKTTLMRKTDTEMKTGVFTGSFAIHPLTRKKIPIWIADYVLGHYGSGAVMGVPAGDTRDYLFAKNHQLPFQAIFLNQTNQPLLTEPETYINSDFINGLKQSAAIQKILAVLKQQKLGETATSYKLHDWLFSRQRYWGEPFPLIHWDDGTISAVPEHDLPVILPKLTNFKPSVDGLPPLANADHKWLRVTRSDGVKGTRELNTMPQWAGSCWYYLAYLLIRENGTYEELTSPIAQQRFTHWLPVDLYIGGQEHAVLHLLYARFWHLVLYDLKLVNVREPFQKLINQGMILGENHEKMSKSRGNVINPDDVIDTYGADTLRLYEMFIGPIADSTPWKSNGITGVHKFLIRVYRLFYEKNLKAKMTDQNNEELTQLYHQTVAQVTNDIENLAFNTAIAKLMMFINGCYLAKQIYRDYLLNFLKLLNPFAPHLSSELWSLTQTNDINRAGWPVYDKNYLTNQTVQIAVQINGKTKTLLTAKTNETEANLAQLAKTNLKLQPIFVNQTIIKTIFVPNKIINFVIKPKKD